MMADWREPTGKLVAVKDARIGEFRRPTPAEAAGCCLARSAKECSRPPCPCNLATWVQHCVDRAMYGFTVVDEVGKRVDPSTISAVKDPCLYPLEDGRRCLECSTCRPPWC